ncbi:MAG TPA: FMN-binding glutamate synthase family protein, partial [Thermaerobacter sp.]
MIPFLQVSIAFLGIVTALALLVLLGRRVGRALFDRAVDRALRRLLKDPYPENLWDLVIGMTRVPPHLLMETELRAETGKMLERPLGSIVRVSDFSAIAFNPAQLVRQPLPPAAPVDTSVVLGPACPRPL